MKHALLVPLLAVALGGCLHPHVPAEQIEDMPKWRTDPESVRLALVEELLDASDGNANTVGALDIVRQLRADGEKDPVLDLLQGKALRIDGVTSESERLLLIARKRMGRDARPSQELCILYADLQRLDEAVSECQRATELDEGDAAAWNNLGFLLLAADRPAEGLEAAQKAVQLDASQPRYRNNLGMALAAVGREQQAYKALQSTMSRADAAYMVGLSIERYHGLDAARPWYEKALDLDPNHAQAKDSLAALTVGVPAAVPTAPNATAPNPQEADPGERPAPPQEDP